MPNNKNMGMKRTHAVCFALKCYNSTYSRLIVSDTIRGLSSRGVSVACSVGSPCSNDR